jgi:hypothetical protein
METEGRNPWTDGDIVPISRLTRHQQKTTEDKRGAACAGRAPLFFSTPGGLCPGMTMRCLLSGARILTGCWGQRLCEALRHPVR